MTKLEVLKVQHALDLNYLRLTQAVEIAELIKTGEQDMPVSPEVAALISKFDVATTAIADRIAKLMAGAHLSAEDQAALQAEVDKLTALGADPNNPVP